MKKNLNFCSAGLMFCLLIIFTPISRGQGDKAIVRKYLSGLPDIQITKAMHKYNMTAIYTNRDLYGNFTGKFRVSGDYTRGLTGDSAMWDNVYISSSNKFSDPFPAGTKQEYMEKLKYVPSSKMLLKDSFKNFPGKTEAVFAKNLIWDMMAIEEFAWKYLDSLKLNKYFIIRPKAGGFEMGGVGNYSHDNIQVRWTGISEMNNEICAIIEYIAIDNMLEINMDQIKGKGTEQYWGTTWISLKSGIIEYADTYSGTIQEIQVKGMDNKFLAKTIREIKVTKIL
jgi:hypothetical protein